jgi:hypothetical protein
MFDLTMDGHHMGAQWSESWLKQGMTVDGSAYPLPPSVRPTSEIGGGLWPTPVRFPTPMTTDADPNGGPPNKNANTTQWDGVNSLGQMAKTGLWPTPRAGKMTDEDNEEDDLVTAVGGSLSPDWVSWLMGLPVGWTSLVPLPQEDYDQWLQMQQDGTWWLEEQGQPRVAVGIENRVNRLKCLGNGIVPASAALAIKDMRFR